MARTKKPKPITCEWTQDDYGGDCHWETQCGNAFEFNDGGPVKNHAVFCCYCGGRLVEVRTSELRARPRGERQ
jgi:hypothetical protein